MFDLLLSDDYFCNFLRKKKKLFLQDGAECRFSFFFLVFICILIDV